MKKPLILLFIILFSSHITMAQTPVRVFTYDAAGNRVAMGVGITNSSAGRQAT